MKVAPFPAAPNYVYKFRSFSSHDVARFPSQASCPACGATSRRPVLARLGGRTPDEALGVVCCTECAHVTYDRLPDEAWLGEYYARIWDQAGRATRTSVETDFEMNGGFPVWGLPWNYFSDLQVPQDARILDFGCGYGDGLSYLRHLGYHNTYGVDPGTHRADCAERHFPNRVRLGSVAEAEELASEVGPFDLILLHHVAEHLRSPYEVAARLGKLLQRRGMLVIAVPEMFSECPLFPTLYFPHLHHFNTTSMLAMMRRAGLNPFRWTGVMQHLVVAAAPDSDWKPEGPFKSVTGTLTSEFTDSIAKFITAPWTGNTDRETVGMNYFHPWFAPQYPQGFQYLGDAYMRWLDKGLQISERRGYGRYLDLGRNLFGRDILPSGHLLGFRRDASDRSDVLWIVRRDGDVPVLVK